MIKMIKKNTEKVVIENKISFKLLKEFVIIRLIVANAIIMIALKKSINQ